MGVSLDCTTSELAHAAQIWYMLAIVAAQHNVPFFVAAPVTTLDPGEPCTEGRPLSDSRMHSGQLQAGAQSKI
eukprot:999161-Pelagomonas_calceolata.AAC.4